MASIPDHDNIFPLLGRPQDSLPSDTKYVANIFLFLPN